LVYKEVSREEEKGTADALLKNRAFIDRYDVEDVLILHSDHIYNFDYRDMYEQHKQSGAALTLGYQRIPKRFVKLFGMVSFDQHNNLTEFVEKPVSPSSDNIFTAVCIFNKKIMYSYLSRLEQTDWRFDISHDLIPLMLTSGECIKGYAFKGYWEDIGTTQRYYEGHMKLIHQQVELNAPLSLSGSSEMTLFRDKTFDNVIMPQSYSLQDFTAKNSLIYPGAIIGKGCHIENSVVLPDAQLSAGTHLVNALLNAHETETFEIGSSI
jgi:glucose-1-phosphate adenylyltransferase